MGTKRIGRVGERDAGFHSNGALPSALSCCHYGSEVFRSCRKQSYGKPACLDSPSACLFFFPSVPSWLHLSTVVMWCDLSHTDVVSGSSFWSCICFPFPFYCVFLFTIFKVSSGNQHSIFYLSTAPLHHNICHHSLFFFLMFLMNSRPQLNECCPCLAFCWHKLHFCGLSLSHLSYHLLNS